MKDTNLDTLKDNIISDLNTCSKNELELIYQGIKSTLKEFDRDNSLKNCCDFFKSIFKSKKEKCVFFINDIVDSKDKLTLEEKEKLRKKFLDISNIHRSFIENLIALFEAL